MGRQRRNSQAGTITGKHFSHNALATIFELRVETSDICQRRESATLEFKENFHLSDEFLAKTAKSMAAFANNRGGYLVFGVTPKPHQLKGMTNDKFEKMDPSKLTQFLASHFQPTIEWDHMVHEQGGKRFGLISVFPNPNRPVIATSSVPNCFREGEVIFRYAGESRSIKAADLIDMISDRIEQERKSWQRMLTRMASLRPDHTWILDGTSGELSAGNMQLFIAPELLKKIKWIKEGQFKETSGEPGLRVVGDVQVASGGPIVATQVVPKAITTETIINSFLSGVCTNPAEYLEALPYAGSIYLPMWFFIAQARMTSEQAIDHIRRCRYAGSTRRDKLIQRLNADAADSHIQGALLPLGEAPTFTAEQTFITDLKVWKTQVKLSKNRESSLVRTAIFKVLSEGRGFDWPDDFWDEYRNITCEAITHLPAETVNYLKDPLISLVKRLGQTDLVGNELSTYRRTLCYLDVVLYKESTEKLANVERLVATPKQESPALSLINVDEKVL